MSKMIKERTPDQCRGHHRKMISRYFTCEEIKTGLRKMIKREAVKETKIEEKIEEEGEVSKFKFEVGEKLAEQATLYIVLDINQIGVW